MNIHSLASLLRSEQFNQALDFLSDIVLDNNEELVGAIVKLIENPARIADTNRFASILKAIPHERYRDSLAQCIQKATLGSDPWLSDYLYALDAILEFVDEPWAADDELVSLLGRWLLETGGGEISWKAGILLSWVSNPLAKEIMLRAARDASLFHQTRIQAIHGIANNFRDELHPLLDALSADDNEHIQETVRDARVWLDQEKNS